ncbi:MAG: GTPase Era, partial [Cyanobacteria bacterium P01_F01_bin.86]
MTIDLGGTPTPPPGFRSGFVGIVGRPNVGKSTLMNVMVGQKIAITSPIAQTTRNRLRGVMTLPEAQVIFVDTPGIHKPHHELGKVLVKNARIAINSVDITLFVVDGSSELGRGDLFIADLLKRSDVPVILGINKADLQSETRAQMLDISYQSLADDQGWPVCKFSAVTEAGLEQLKSSLVERLEKGPYYYPPDLVTDQ